MGPRLSLGCPRYRHTDRDLGVTPPVLRPSVWKGREPRSGVSRQGQDAWWLATQAAGAGPGLPPGMLCGLRQVTGPLCASVSMTVPSSQIPRVCVGEGCRFKDQDRQMGQGSRQGLGGLSCCCCCLWPSALSPHPPAPPPRLLTLSPFLPASHASGSEVARGDCGGPGTNVAI